ncbi:FAD:protein FMN transferase [Candidatus Woesearchaeota archaeon]|nr:FAD:protein FMN transferase [Candidatus Woesearchaeota archaeon]
MRTQLSVQRQEVLGTVVEIKVPKIHADCLASCFAELKRIEKTYSRFLDDSALSQANKKIGKWQGVSDEFLWLIKQAELYKKKTKGYFDITIKEVLDSMGYDKTYRFTPQQMKSKGILHGIKEAIMQPIVIDDNNNKILLRKEIDFGGIGKGYALDKVAELLESKGVVHYYINAGGDIYARQSHRDEPWIILLEHPDDPARAIGKIKLDRQAIAGSSSNRRRWGKQGEYHHLINPKTQKPAEKMKAIFVIAEKGMDADVYATGLFATGFEEAIRLSKELPVEVLMISKEDKMFRAKGLR